MFSHLISRFGNKLMSTKQGRMGGLLVVSGPSGSGKSTLLKRLLVQFPEKFGFSISHTTRNPRNGELNGQDYHFVTKEEFDQLIKNDSMVEWAQFSQNMYGTSKEALKNVQSTGKTCILDIELEGVKSIKKSGIEAKFILIKAPNLQELKSRLIERGSENEASLESRLKRAKDDLEYAEKHNLYDITIINDNVENSFQEFKEYCLCYSSEK